MSIKLVKKTIFLLAIGLAGLQIVGCQTLPYQGKAREVKKKPNENGVIAVPVDARTEDRNLAETKMKANCPEGKYRILEEGEIVTGQATVSDSSSTNRDRNQHQVGSLFGMPVTSGDAGGVDNRSATKTEQLKEWQISYDCNAKTKTK